MNVYTYFVNKIEKLKNISYSLVTNFVWSMEQLKYKENTEMTCMDYICLWGLHVSIHYAHEACTIRIHV